MHSSQKEFLSAVVFGVIVFCIIILLIGIVAMPKKSGEGLQLAPTSHVQNSSSSAGGAPEIKMTDMAPKIDASQKTAVLVQHSDSSYEKFLVATDAVDAFSNALPKGDKVISITPLK